MGGKNCTVLNRETANLTKEKRIIHMGATLLRLSTIILILGSVPMSHAAWVDIPLINPGAEAGTIDGWEVGVIGSYMSFIGEKNSFNAVNESGKYTLYYYFLTGIRSHRKRIYFLHKYNKSKFGQYRQYTNRLCHPL
jgi:hypothetical protein